MTKTLLIATLSLLASPAMAQTLGQDGTMVNETARIPQCAAPLGTVALVEEKKAETAGPDLPPGIAAMMAMARAQQGYSTATVDPIPLLKMLASQSGCFQVVDRGQGFEALQRERAMNAGVSAPALVAADYMLTAQIVYQDENAGGGGGAIGGLGAGFGGFGGVKSKKLESQVMLTLVAVRSGVQEAAATGAARKRDLKIIAGGLVGLGLGALGGGYDSTDIGKITAAAILDAYGKLVPQAVRVHGVAAAAPARAAAVQGAANAPR